MPSNFVFICDSVSGTFLPPRIGLLVSIFFPVKSRTSADFLGVNAVLRFLARVCSSVFLI